MAAEFDLQKRLGKGYFGEVWLAIDTGLNTERAIKLIPPTKVLNPKNLSQEAQILKAVEHPNIVRVEETGTLGDGRIYVAMEYLFRGSLEDEAKGAYVDLTRARRIMIDVLRGLEYAHTRSILHRDIKPANILIGANSEGKLSDFGLAIPAGLNLRALGVKDYAYTLHLAPEVLLGKQYSVVTDIYACGVTLYRLVNGDTYLPSLSPSERRHFAIQGKFPDRSKYRDFVPRPLRMIINRAIHLNPVKRFNSAEQMRHALEQVPIEKNWRERVLPEGYEWTCGWNNKCYELRRVHDRDKSWSVTVKRGRSTKALRRMTEFCESGLTRVKADQISRRLLQDFVLGKIK